jgi:MFS family permease
VTAATAPEQTAKASGGVLITLASAQFLMTLDSSVMNVSIATVAKDVGTTVTGIQGAITAYTLVMAALMITGAKVGALIGRKRAFAIGCVIYACGSFTTAVAPNLPVLLFGCPFISDSDLESALDKAQVSSKTTDAALDAYRDARIAGLRAALAILAILAIVALFLAQRIPTRQPAGPTASG